MQDAIEANLQQFFAESTNVGEDILEASYTSVIGGTIDSAGNTVTSFVLSTPTGTISVGVNELPLLGSITF